MFCWSSKEDYSYYIASEKKFAESVKFVALPTKHFVSQKQKTSIYRFSKFFFLFFLIIYNSKLFFREPNSFVLNIYLRVFVCCCVYKTNDIFQVTDTSTLFTPALSPVLSLLFFALLLRASALSPTFKNSLLLPRI